MEELDTAITPLLEKLRASIPDTTASTIEWNEADGKHLTLKVQKLFYKVLGSEYNHTEGKVYLDMVASSEDWRYGYESTLLERKIVKGDTTNLHNNFLEQYDWIASVVHHIITSK